METARSLAAHGAEVVGAARGLQLSRCERKPLPMAEASNWLNSTLPT